jgi:hypothetical protein
MASRETDPSKQPCTFGKKLLSVMDDPTDERECESDASRWPLLWVGGAVSLCCIFAAPATGGAAVGGTLAGGATAALGGTLIQILVVGLTVGLIGLVLRLRSSSNSCERDATPSGDT